MQKDLSYGLDALAVTPSDTNLLVRPALGTAAQTTANPNWHTPANDAAGTVKPQLNIACAMMVAASGTVKILDALGNAQTLTLPPNVQVFCRVAQVFATGTTATGITVFYPIYD